MAQGDGLCRCSGRKFYFDRKGSSVGVHDEIDFSSSCGAPIPYALKAASEGEEDRVFDQMPVEQVIGRSNRRPGTGREEDPWIVHIDFRHLAHFFARVRKPRWHEAEYKGSLQNIQIPADGLCIEAECGPQLALVELRSYLCAQETYHVVESCDVFDSLIPSDIFVQVGGKEFFEDIESQCCGCEHWSWVASKAEVFGVGVLEEASVECGVISEFMDFIEGERSEGYVRQSSAHKFAEGEGTDYELFLSSRQGFGIVRQLKAGGTGNDEPIPILCVIIDGFEKEACMGNRLKFIDKNGRGASLMNASMSTM